MGSAFETTIVQSEGAAVVVMRGTVDRAAKDTLEAAYETAAATAGQVLLDFGGVDYINSTGIAVIVGVLAKARAAGRDIGAYGLTDHYREIFTITRLADFLTIYDDETAAVLS